MRKVQQRFGMELSKVVDLLNDYCQPHLADKWDNTGLLIQPSPPFSVNKILVTNDLTEPVLDEALKKNANMIISYHPPIFSPIKKLTQNHWKERIVIRSLENRIAVYSPHTGLDAKYGGINDWLLSPFGLTDKRILSPSPYNLKPIIKFPVVITDRFADFVLKSGVSLTSSQIESSKGKLAELTVPEASANEAFEMAKQMQIPILESVLISKNQDEGYGRVATLNHAVTLSGAIEKYKTLFGMKNILVAIGQGKTLHDPVRAIAVCAGSGGSVLCKNPMAWVADLFVTGELSHHERLEVVSKGISIILAGHSNSERGFFRQEFIPNLKALFESKSAGGDASSSMVELIMSECDFEPGDFM